VFTHYCFVDDEAFTTYFNPDFTCNSHKENFTVKDSHACCEKTNSDNSYDFFVSDDCCSNEVNVVQIDTELITHNFNIEIIGGFPALAPEIKIFPLIKDEKEVLLHNPPPKFLMTSERLATFQRYLI